MPLTVLWDDEPGGILRVAFVDRWTWEEFITASLTVIQHLNARNGQRMDVISDMSHTSYMPPNYLKSVGQVLELPSPPNLGLAVLMGTRFAYNVFEAYNRLSPVAFRYCYAPTLAAAHTLIAQSRSGSALDSYLPPASGGN
jgi:hypothetical protein